MNVGKADVVDFAPRWQCANWEMFSMHTESVELMYLCRYVRMRDLMFRMYIYSC